VRETLSPDGAVAPPFASAAVVAGDWIFVSGQLATDWQTGLTAADSLRRPPVKAQIESIYDNLQKILAAAGAGLDSLARVELFFLDRDDVQRTIEERDLREGDVHHPTSAAVLVDALVVPGALLQIEPMAFRPQPGKTLEAIDMPGAAVHARASFSKGIVYGQWVVTAGNVARDPSGASVIAPEAFVDPNYWLGSPITQQTVYIVRRRLAEVLDAAGCGLEDVVRAQVYLTNPARDYAAFCEIWFELFPNGAPSTVVIPVSGLGLGGAVVEISFVAVQKGMVDIVAIAAERDPAPRAVRSGDIVWCSTIAALDEAGLAADAADLRGLPFLESPGMRQMREILERLGRTLDAAGSTIADLAKLTVFSSDLSELPGFVTLWREAFASSPPAIGVVQVPGPILGVPGCTVAVDAIASWGGAR
jgi:enamine deaminase RidA (YjgF/YER057c/UK114 family)